MSKKVIIIGAGVSGLSAGIFARKKGFETLILEKNHFSGGNLTGWKRKDCYIDNCIHWLCGSKKGNSLNKLWNELGAFENINFHQSEDFVVSELNNLTISLNKNIDTTYKNMLKLSPFDKKEISKFIKAVKLISSLENQSGPNKLNTFLKLFSIYKRKTIKEVADNFKHPLLKKLITDYLGENFSIYVLLFAYSSYSSGDGKVIKEGSYKMAQNITDKYLSLGGEIKYNSSVKNILIKDSIAIGVELDNNEQILGDIIISTVDPSLVFKKFIKTTMPKCLEKTYKNSKTYPVVSSFHIAYKVNSNISIPETFVFEVSSPIKIASSIYKRITIRSYAYGTDFTPDNSFVLQVFLLQNEKDYEKWKSYSPEEYKQEKQKAIKEITNSIIERFPELQDKIEFLDCWTPLTYTKYFNAYKGSYMSFIITKMFKFTTLPQKCKSIENLYFASQWQRLFGGLPNALNSGKNCIEQISKKHLA